MASETRRNDEPGSHSPASEEAKEQGFTGAQGGPREARGEGSGDAQPRQGTQHNEGHGEEPEERKSFAPGQAPSEQGRGEPRPQQIAKNQQGIGAKSGSRGAHDEHGEEEAQRGEPAAEHTRHGRQHVPGDRPRD